MSQALLDETELTTVGEVCLSMFQTLCIRGMRRSKSRVTQGTAVWKPMNRTMTHSVWTLSQCITGWPRLEEKAYDQKVDTIVSCLRLLPYINISVESILEVLNQEYECNASHPAMKYMWPCLNSLTFHPEV